MTISILGKSLSTAVTAYHHTLEGVPGHIVSIGASSVFLSDADADRLGRYLLFDRENEQPAGEPSVPEGEDGIDNHG